MNNKTTKKCFMCKEEKGIDSLVNPEARAFRICKSCDIKREKTGRENEAKIREAQIADKVSSMGKPGWMESRPNMSRGQILSWLFVLVFIMVMLVVLQNRGPAPCVDENDSACLEHYDRLW